MAFDTFLKLTGIDGESTAVGFEKSIEVYSFSWGASNPSTVGSGASGLSAGKVSISSFNVMKKSETSSAKIFQSCATGQHIDSATVSMRKAGGTAGQVVFLEYKFTDVLIESVQWSGSSGGDDTPTESLSIAFGKVEITYNKQDSKTGKASVAGQASWDLTKVTT
jgi:type VI secretion system secreted protein Hcp